MVSHPGPWQQLRRSPGGVAGLRDRFPQTYESLPDTPSLGALFDDNPRLNSRKYVHWYKEFGTTNTEGEWSMVNTGTGTGLATLNSERNGVVQLASGTSNNGFTFYGVGSAVVFPFSNLRNPYMEMRAVLTTALGTAAVRHVGFASDPSVVAPTDLICFRTSGGTANWFAVTRAAGSETTVDTNIAAATGTWYLFVIRIWAKGTKVTFEMWSDANPRLRVFGPVTMTATIPTAALVGGLRTMNPNPAEGATRDIAIDYGYIYQLRQNEL